MGYTPLTMRRVALLLGAVLAISACGSPKGQYGRPAHFSERATVAGHEVTDEAFASAVRDLLSAEPGSRERALRLQAVVEKQMSRAKRRLQGAEKQRGLAALAGAMYLTRAGELTPEALGASGPDVLRAASLEYARRGDDGRARATYEMLLRVAPPAEHADIKFHLAAIDAWTRDTAAGSPILQAGAKEVHAVTRHLLEPSKEARDEAAQRTGELLDRALALQAAYRARRVQPAREEGNEAVRALTTGGTVLVAIYLRNADVHGALAAVEKSRARELVKPDLMHALEAVADRPDSEKWLDLARAIRPPTPREAARDDEDWSRDIDVLRVAALACAMEAYRLDATAPEPAALVASTLVDLGMAEAAPAVLLDAVKAGKDPRILGVALGITLHAMTVELDAEDADAARRAFAAAEPILKAGDAAGGRAQPTPARVRAVMGEIEVREGRLDAARALLTEAAKHEKLGATLLSLARIDWHDKKIKSALDRLNEALGADDTQKIPTLRAEILLLVSDITREQGDVGAARTPLTEALKDLAKARTATRAEDRARVERLLSRVLDRFGEAAKAQQALERSLDAAARDKREVAATVGQLVARAFVRGDLASARDALSRGLLADLAREDIVYYALWVRVLEKQTKAPVDKTAERVLEGASGDPRWIGRIAAFGTGKLKGSDLVASATTPTQRTEALFYSAMELRLSGDAKGAEETLKKVVGSTGLDLMEVALARELLSPANAKVSGPVPEVGLP